MTAHEDPSEAGEACDNTKRNSHYARSCDGHRYHPQSAHEAKVREEGREGIWWHAWAAVSMATVQAMAGTGAGKPVLER